MYSPLGLAGPKGMDPAVVTRLRNAFRKATTNSFYHKALGDYDPQSRPMSSNDYRKFAGEQFARGKVLLSQLGFKPKYACFPGLVRVIS